MIRNRLKYVSPSSLAKNLGLVFFCFGLLGSILGVFLRFTGAEFTLGGPVQFTETGSRSYLVLFLNPLLVGGYGYIGGLVGGWFYNLAADKSGGLVYYAQPEQETENDTG